MRFYSSVFAILLGAWTPAPWSALAAGGPDNPPPNRSQIHALPSVAVRDYTRCDGSNDDYSGLQRALNAAKGGVLRFPEDPNVVCTLSQSLLISGHSYDHTTILGHVTIKPTSGNTSLPVLLKIENASHITVGALIFDGTSGTSFGTANVGVQVNGAAGVVDHVVFEGARFQHITGRGLSFTNGFSYSGCVRCVFSDIGNKWKVTNAFTDRFQAITMSVNTAGRNVGNFVDYSEFRDLGLDGVSAGDQDDVRISYNRFYLANNEYNAPWGVQPSAFPGCIYNPNTLRIQVIGNYCHGVAGTGIDLPYGEREVVGNWVENTGGDGIGIYHTGSAIVKGNTIKNPALSQSGGAGIAVTNKASCITLTGALDSIVIAGNRCGDDQTTHTMQYGINIKGDARGSNSIWDLRLGADNAISGTVVSSFGGAYATAGVETATVGGAATVGDVLTLTLAKNGTTQSIAHTVQNGEDNNAIAAALLAGLQANSTLTAAGFTFSAASNVITYAVPGQGWVFSASLVGAAGAATETLPLGSGAAGNVLGVTGLTASAENRIINPCFLSDRRHEGASVSSTAPVALAERWKGIDSHAAVSHQRLISGVNSPSPDCHSYNETSVTTQRTPVTGDFLYFGQIIRSADILDLNYGAGGKTLILDLCGWSTNAGTRAVAVQNSNAVRSYLISYTLAANKKQCFSFIIPPDSFSLGNSLTAQGMKVLFDLGDAHCSATAGQWIAGAVQCLTGNEQLVTEPAGSKLDISGVRLYVGSLDVPWAQRSYTQELTLMRQFYRSTFPAGVAPAQNAGLPGARCQHVAASGGAATLSFREDPPMVQTPSVTLYNPSAANGSARDVTAGSDLTATVDTNSSGPSGVEVFTANVPGQNDQVCLHVALDAEF